MFFLINLKIHLTCSVLAKLFITLYYVIVSQENDPLLGSSPLKMKILGLEGGTYGGFPIEFLVLVVSALRFYTERKSLG